MFRFDQPNRRWCVILTFRVCCCISNLFPKWLHASLPFPPPKRGMSRVGCGHAGAMSLYHIRYSCSNRVRLLQEQKKNVGWRWLYVCVNHTTAAPMFFLRPFRTRTESYTVLSLALALYSYISLGLPFYDRSKVSIPRTHLESSLSSL